MEQASLPQATRSPLGCWKNLPTNDLFHRLWTKAVGTNDYDKEEWLELERRLMGIQP